MTAIFTTIFTDALKATPTLMNASTMKMYLFPRAPAFDANDTRYTSVTTVAELITKLGWGGYLTPSPANFTVGTVDAPASVNRYVIRDNPVMMDPAWNEALVAAVAFEMVSGTLAGKLAFITNRPFSEGPVVIGTQDGVTAQINPLLGTGTAGTRDFFNWSLTGATSAPSAQPVEGSIVLYRGTPDFEPAKTQHIWQFPQRINMIANPSFENDTRFWRYAGTLGRGSGFAPGPGGGSFFGRLTGQVIESNQFPLMIRKEIPEGWTIQLQARGDGELKVGLVSWPSSYAQTVVDWGPDEEVWHLTQDWKKVRSLRRINDVSMGMLRLETDGSYIDIDHVCCEPGFLPENLADWPYFDGESIFGAEGDYSWYGDRPHASYSCWINHRAGVNGRLFAWDVVKGASPDVITDEEARQQGLAYQWVPAGTPVTYHDDVLFAGDPQTPVMEPTGTVLPHAYGPPTTPPTTGVQSPWPPLLISVTSTVTGYDWKTPPYLINVASTVTGTDV